MTECWKFADGEQNVQGGLQSPDPMIKGLLEYHRSAHNRNERSEYREVVKILNRYGLSMKEVVAGSQKLKRAQVLALKQHLAAKVVHETYYKTVTNQPADKEHSTMWLMQGVLQSRTEVLIMAIRDGVTKVLTYRQRILKEDINPTCRMCEKGKKLWDTSATIAYFE